MELVFRRNSTVDSELSCPVLVAPHMSASSGSVLPRGTVGNALALSTFPQAAPPSGVRRRIFWEVKEAVSLGKRVIPILCRPLDDVAPPPELAELNYTYFYAEPKFPGSGFGTGLAKLVTALNTDPDWLREHTRYLRLAEEWEEVGKPSDRRPLS